MPTTDESRLAELPGGTRVYGVSVPVSRVEAAQFAVWRTVRPLIRGGIGRRQPDEPAGGQKTADAAGAGLPGAGLPGPLARAYFARMDFARMARWARRVADEAATVADPGVHRVIVSSGPPHMVHEAGRRLAKRTRRPFVMDLRGPDQFRKLAGLLRARGHSQRVIDKVMGKNFVSYAGRVWG